MAKSVEHGRLEEAKAGKAAWRRWGPYLSERQWGTVREDYSENGDAWNYFTHDQARSRAYRWGEDGIAGISDDKQLLCFALALWNGHDPILKERMFGLTNSEGNHGEDVKEYYFYVDSTPSHSYMKYLYKYPQAAYPYDEIVAENKRRSRDEFEYELIDTGVFDESRYFDVFVEYAKADANDLLISITAHNRGPEAAELTLLPTLWLRNTWSWSENAYRPSLNLLQTAGDYSAIEVKHAFLGKFFLYCEGAHDVLFTENETNSERVFGVENRTPYVKDAFHRYVIHGETESVNPEHTGSKAAPLIRATVAAGGSHTVRLRLTPTPPAEGEAATGPFAGFDAVLAQRKAEADAFYEAITPASLTQDEHLVFRQALAGMLWSKQYYGYDVAPWLRGDAVGPAGDVRRNNPRNAQWFHMVNEDILSMPDKWEYPWYAAWDLAFHALALEIVDPDFAKAQLLMMLNEDYMHPNGQLPAYEWNFSDVNPPVHAWAVYYIFNQERAMGLEPDIEFVKTAFQKLLMNFTWWVNRKDRNGSNVFEGGFLGLDNIGVFDRSAPLPTGGYLEQADGTAWMAFFSLMMLNMSIVLRDEGKVYEDFACRFFEQFLLIAGAMDRIGDNQDELWDEEDGFFYDLLRMPDGSAFRLKVRSMVGLLPLAANVCTPPGVVEEMPSLGEVVRWFRTNRPDVIANLSDLGVPNAHGRRLLSISKEDNLKRILSYMLDEDEFLSPHGLRALSRYHQDHPFVLNVGDQEYRVDYLPAESNNGLFGGNSNWRGPVWMPVNVLLVRSMLVLYSYFGDEMTVEMPTGSGNQQTLWDVGIDLAERLTSIFLRNEKGERPVFGGTRIFQDDPHWRDLILFYEYFHGDNGAGLGASHQTGWTGCAALLLHVIGQGRTPEGRDMYVNVTLNQRTRADAATAQAGAAAATAPTD